MADNQQPTRGSFSAQPAAKTVKTPTAIVPVSRTSQVLPWRPLAA